VRRLLRLAVVAALAVWAWRRVIGGRRSDERATVAFADGSALVLEPGSAEFDRLSATARAALHP
jgi:prepilin-type processing-associated H-X9-DG protein